MVPHQHKPPRKEQWAQADGLADLRCFIHNTEIKEESYLMLKVELIMMYGACLVSSVHG